MTFYAIAPVAAPRMTKKDRWAKRPVVMRYFAFRDAVRLAKIVLPPLPCKVIFWVEMPASWSKKKRAAMDGMPHLQRPDRDNFDKALMDALFANDAHIWSLWPEKRWTTTPGIEINQIFTPLRAVACPGIPPSAGRP